MSGWHKCLVGIRPIFSAVRIRISLIELAVRFRYLPEQQQFPSRLHVFLSRALKKKKKEASQRHNRDEAANLPAWGPQKYGCALTRNNMDFPTRMGKQSHPSSPQYPCAQTFRCRQGARQYTCARRARACGTEVFLEYSTILHWDGQPLTPDVRTHVCSVRMYGRFLSPGSTPYSESGFQPR